MDAKKPTLSPKNPKKPTIFNVASSATPSADSILRELHAVGIRLELQGDLLNASPAARLTDELRDLVRANKPALVAYLTEAHQTAAHLIESAMQACDHHGDGPEAREAMRRDCLETPPHLRADLLAHFRGTYPSCYERGKGEEVQKGQLRRR